MPGGEPSTTQGDLGRISADAPADEAVPGSGRVLVQIATYNELDNLPKLVELILKLVPQANVLVIDDNSPDGTAQWCRSFAQGDSRLSLMVRPKKLGLGTAIKAGMEYAIQHGYYCTVNLDADFSHDPNVIPALVTALDENGEGAGIIIGSRYVAGGGTRNWPLRRRIMSWGVNFLARIWLRWPVRDSSGAFRCYRVEALKSVELAKCRARGFSFNQEILWRIWRKGWSIREIPITFEDREHGKSKASLREVIQAFKTIIGLRFS